jgi:branched-chain amino acid transport system ATP-binding protein
MTTGVASAPSGRTPGARSEVLVLETVVKRFGGVRALSGVSLRIERGSIFGLIGPNGAGKTTVFNLITGLYRPDEGDVRFDGASVAGSSPARLAAAGIARTFQNVRLFGHLSVLDNVLVAAESARRTGLLGALLRSPRALAEERVLMRRARQLLDRLELGGVAREPAASLPYGSQRRLEIARALMLSPKVLLLDEPAAGLNHKEADVLRHQIVWLRDHFDLTIVLIEHNMRVVMQACERVHVLDRGETIAEGTAAEIRSDRRVLMAYMGEPTSAEGGGSQS